MRYDVESLQDELVRTRRELEFAREELKVMRPQQTSMRPQPTLEATQGQILSQSPTYATRFWWFL